MSSEIVDTIGLAVKKCRRSGVYFEDGFDDQKELDCRHMSSEIVDTIGLAVKKCMHADVYFEGVAVVDDLD
jgi:hypothetical protein